MITVGVHKEKQSRNMFLEKFPYGRSVNIELVAKVKYRFISCSMLNLKPGMAKGGYP